MAVNEPALSFEFDSSQSLFEQLTKAQQANSSSFSGHVTTSYSQSTSPVMRAVDSMPPPQMVPQSMPMTRPQEQPQHAAMYNGMSVTSGMQQSVPAGYMPKEQDYSDMQYDRNGVPLSRVHQRHTSMPVYMEYSPAPSFVSSHYEDYSNRGISYEPVTPPQHVSMSTEPAYIANEDTGLYTAIPEMGSVGTYNPMAQLPPSNLAGPQFSAATRTFPSTNVYSVIEGSPTYKQRRRRSSIPSSIMNAVAANAAAHANGQVKSHTVHRPSSLQRSVSSSVVPLTEADESTHDSPPGLTHSYPSTIVQRHELSRNGTPLPSLEESPRQAPMSIIHASENLNHLVNDDMSVHTSPSMRSERPGPVRRARSATMMELGVPYKSHSCPIPSCGRLFKRLEHLKRYVSPSLVSSFLASISLSNFISCKR